MQTLAEKGKIDGAGSNRRRFEISDPVIDVRDTVVFCKFRSEFHHFRGVVHCNHTLRSLGEKLRKRSFARTEIGDRHGRHELKQGLGERLPGATGNVIPSELAGQFIEIAAYFVASLLKRELQSFRIVRDFRNLLSSRAQDRQQSAILQAIKAVLAQPSIFHESRLAQLGQVRRDAALTHRENLLKLGNRQFFAFQQQQDADSRGIGKQPQRFEYRCHASVW